MPHEMRPAAEAVDEVPFPAEVVPPTDTPPIPGYGEDVLSAMVIIVRVDSLQSFSKQQT
jgi:hypothetical protein